MFCLSAVLFDGTAETALQDLTDLSEYTERRRKWESGVKFSVEQVYTCSPRHPSFMMLYFPFRVFDSVAPRASTVHEATGLH